jgi:hypothetical protein
MEQNRPAHVPLGIFCANKRKRILLSLALHKKLSYSDHYAAMILQQETSLPWCVFSVYSSSQSFATKLAILIGLW